MTEKRGGVGGENLKVHALLAPAGITCRGLINRGLTSFLLPDGGAGGGLFGRAMSFLPLLCGWALLPPPNVAQGRRLVNTACTSRVVYNFRPYKINNTYTILDYFFF